MALQIYPNGFSYQQNFWTYPPRHQVDQGAQIRGARGGIGHHRRRGHGGQPDRHHPIGVAQLCQGRWGRGQGAFRGGAQHGTQNAWGIGLVRTKSLGEDTNLSDLQVSWKL